MDRQKVNSSNIDSIGYNENNLTLEVEFKDGSIYKYFDVPHSSYIQLMSASSHGKYLNEYIKSSYSHLKME